MLVTDIDLLAKTIHIKALKNGVEGNHFLFDGILPLVKNWLEIRNEIKSDSLYLFLTKKRKGRICEQSIWDMFRTYAHLSKIPADKHKTHTLRHGVAVAFLSSGYDISFVQMHLRHKQIKSTMVYATIMSEAKHKMQKNAFENAEYFAKIT